MDGARQVDTEGRGLMWKETAAGKIEVEVSIKEKGYLELIQDLLTEIEVQA